MPGLTAGFASPRTGSTPGSPASHPIFSPDDDWVAYTSDATGYCNVYLARVDSIAA